MRTPLQPPSPREATALGLLLALGCSSGPPPEEPAASLAPAADTWRWCSHDDPHTQREVEALRTAVGAPICAEIPAAVAHLTALDLSNQDLSQVEFLKEFDHLEALDLSNNRLESLAPLHRFSRLKRLDVRANRLTSAQDISHLSLEVLRLEANLEPVGALIQTAPQLRAAIAPPTDAFAAHCAESPLLSRLLQRPEGPRDCTELWFSYILDAHLDLSDLSLTALAPAELSVFPGLTHLDLSGNRLTGPLDLTALTDLSHLNLSDNGLQSLANLALPAEISLHLDVSSNQLQAFDLNTAGLYLYSLDLSDNDLRALGLTDPDDPSQPQQLNISGNTSLDLLQLPPITEALILGESGLRLTSVQQLYTDEALQPLTPWLEDLREKPRLAWSLKTPAGCAAVVVLDGPQTLPVWDTFLLQQQQWLWVARTSNTIWDVRPTPTALWLLVGIGHGDPPFPTVQRFAYTGAHLPTSIDDRGRYGSLHALQYRGRYGALQVSSAWAISEDEGASWAVVDRLPAALTWWVDAEPVPAPPCEHPTGFAP